MKSEDQPRFDPHTLRDAAGKTVFARGEAYSRDERVELLSVGPERVWARVNGTESYHVQLFGQGRTFDGDCTCRAFEDRGFCKHLVATALAANVAGDTVVLEGTGTLARIRNHLKGKGVDALVDMIMDIAADDQALFQRLDMAATLTGGDGKAIETRLSRAIDSATHVDGYVDYRSAGAWAADARAVLDTIAELPAKGHGELALKLAERAIDRIESAIEDIDDSDGHCSALIERACDIHLAAALAARPDPVSFARELFVHETKSYDAFDNSVTRYADVLGEEGLAEYRRLALAAWEKLPVRQGGGGIRQNGTRQHHEDNASYYQLRDILDFFAERDGDLDTRIALRAKSLSSQWDYVHLAEFCLRHGRDDEALRSAEEGLWIFEDERPDTRLVFLASKLLTEAGREAEATQHLWRTFKKVTTFEIYRRLRDLEGESACVKALEIIKLRLADRDFYRHSMPDLLVEILMHEKRLDAAWAATENLDVSARMKETLARASEETHREQAIRIYAERVEQLVNLGGNGNYEAAAQLIARIGGLRSAAEQAPYVESLKERHGRRRNFMKLLG